MPDQAGGRVFAGPQDGLGLNALVLSQRHGVAVPVGPPAGRLVADRGPGPLELLAAVRGIARGQGPVGDLHSVGDRSRVVQVALLGQRRKSTSQVVRSGRPRQLIYGAVAYLLER